MFFSWHKGKKDTELKVPKQYSLTAEDQSSNSISNTKGLIDNLIDSNTCDTLDDKKVQNEYKHNAAVAVNRQDCAFGNLLDAFVEDYKSRSVEKRQMKIKFFNKIICVLKTVILAPMILVGILVLRGKLESASLIITMIGTFVEIIAAFMVLPKIIAEYLFDPKEDENFISLIKNMQDYNTRGHDRFRN